MGYSNDNFWKLDKWDKIGIASLIVFFTIFVVLSTFSFASYKINGVIYNGFIGNSSSLPNQISQNSIAKGIYYKLTPGLKYSITINGDIKQLYGYFAYTDGSLAVGTPTKYFTTVNQKQIEFICPDDMNTLFFWSSIIEPNNSIIDLLSVDYNSGMGYSLGILGAEVSPSSLWQVFKISIPYISVVVLFSFGTYLIFHAIREISKGRDV